jgi:hypothetical protein
MKRRLKISSNGKVFNSQPTILVDRVTATYTVLRPQCVIQLGYVYFDVNNNLTANDFVIEQPGLEPWSNAWLEVI